MSLERFLHDLHFEIDRLQPPDWEVDWDNAPLAYKLYEGLPVVPLSAEVPLTLPEEKKPGKPNLSTIGHFLWFVYGLTQCSHSLDTIDSTGHTLQTYRRFVPSGGALYPNECYLYLKLEELPTGIYHYDVAHHQLVLLREGNYDSYLERSLGNRCDLAACFGMVFVSTIFWKNFFKYHNFSYRLQGLDTGVLLGQILEVAKRFGFATGVYFQFLDQAIHHLLGLSAQEESVYAVLPLSTESSFWFPKKDDQVHTFSADDICKEISQLSHQHDVRSQKMVEYPMLVRINKACFQESTRSFQELQPENMIKQEGQVFLLPKGERLSYDLVSACQARYSCGSDFVLQKISQQQLSTLLQEETTSFSYLNDLDGTQENGSTRVALFGCLYGVEGIPDGAYQYASSLHALRPIRLGDQRLALQQGMSLYNVNLCQVPLCLHVVGDRAHLVEQLGYRGYRIQQMEAGMLVQRILLAASALGLGGHPLLGFEARLCDEIYQLKATGITSLIQIPVGFYRLGTRWIGRLHG